MRKHENSYTESLYLRQKNQSTPWQRPQGMTALIKDQKAQAAANTQGEVSVTMNLPSASYSLTPLPLGIGGVSQELRTVSS